jgi:hypothetical protein
VHRDYRVSQERRQGRSGTADGCARIGPHYQLYDRRGDEISLDDVERIVI